MDCVLRRELCRRWCARRLRRRGPFGGIAGNRGRFLCGGSSQNGLGVIHTAGDSVGVRPYTRCDDRACEGGRARFPSGVQKEPRRVRHRDHPHGTPASVQRGREGRVSGRGRPRLYVLGLIPRPKAGREGAWIELPRGSGNVVNSTAKSAVVCLCSARF